MASRQASRKRQRISHDMAAPTRADGTLPGLRHSPLPAPTMAAPTNSATDHHEQTLKTLNTDLEAMRSLLGCKICSRLLYEPYSLACGHTYCYSCLSMWVINHSKKTCPDCRATINQQPTPAYLVREMVLLFSTRNQLLAPGETVQEHETLAQEEAKIVADARSNADPVKGGLFQGVFAAGRRHLEPIHDPTDGVYRCPHCNWELEDGYCNVCGSDVEDIDYSAWSEDEEELDDLEGQVFGEDGAGHYHGDDDFSSDDSAASDVHSIRSDARARPHPQHRTRVALSISSDGEDSEDEDADDADGRGNLMSFVVDDDDIEPASSDDGEDTDVPTTVRNPRRRPMVVLSDDDDESETSTATRRNSIGEDESLEDEPTVPGRQEWKRRDGPTNRSPSVVSTENASETSSAAVRRIQGIPIHRLHPAGQNPDDSHDDSQDTESEVAREYFDRWESTPYDTGSVHSDHELDLGGPAYATYDDEDDPGDDIYDEDDYLEHEDYDSEENWWEGQRNAYRASIQADPPRRSNPSWTNANTHQGFPHNMPPAATTGRQPLPAHPFQLENTLLRTNYNQRNLASQDSGERYRTRPANRSTANVTPGNVARRKRALSIASDDSSQYV